jgi:small subunit ribosomal protein S6
MFKYETLFIIKPDLPEEEIQAVLDRLQDRLGRVGGKFAIINHWGNRDLAYAVKYRGEQLRRGYFVLLTYVGDGLAVEEIERNIKIMDQPFRYLTVKLEDNVDPASVTEVLVTRQAPKFHARPEPRPAEFDDDMADDEEASGPPERAAAPAPAPAVDEGDAGEAGEADEAGEDDDEPDKVDAADDDEEEV